jgi:hypothetical protein
MRLATWNCQTGLGINLGSVEGLNVDVVTIHKAVTKGGFPPSW